MKTNSRNEVFLPGKWIPQELLKHIKEQAEERELSQTYIVVEALREHFANHMNIDKEFQKQMDTHCKLLLNHDSIKIKKGLDGT